MAATDELTPGARKVLEAASRLFYERGIHAVGVDMIAAEAGVTKKTLYDRFGSKDQLVLAYLAARELRWRAFLEDWLARVPESQRALAVFDASARWAAEYSPRGCSFVNARAELPDPTHPAYAVIDEAKRHLLGQFRELVRHAGAQDPRRLGAQLFVVHEGALVTAGLDVLPRAWAHARTVAAQLLTDHALGDPRGASS